MNDNERYLLRAVATDNMKEARKYARAVLDGITSQRDQGFKAQLLRTLDTKSFIELPYNLKELLVAEDVENYPMAKFLIRDGEEAVVNRIISTYKASRRLQELGVKYLPAALLYGASGTGKTELARYIAHKAGLPFIYVRFSSLVNSLLGGTQSNISKVFTYAKSSPCLLCFDEIDAIGMKRGDSQDVSEMSRVVIALMQEMDALPNDVIIIGTTNRFDRLDPALVRRFPINHEVLPLEYEDVEALAKKFFDYCGVKFDYEWLYKEMPCHVPHPNDISRCILKNYTASEVVTKCTDYIVDKIIMEEEAV